MRLRPLKRTAGRRLPQRGLVRWGSLSVSTKSPTSSESNKATRLTQHDVNCPLRQLTAAQSIDSCMFGITSGQRVGEREREMPERNRETLEEYRTDMESVLL